MPTNAYHFDIGAIHGRIIADSSDEMTEEQIAAIFPKDSDRILEVYQAIPGLPLKDSRNILLLESAGKRVLVDAGLGVLNPREKGWLLDTLSDEGIAPKSIDTIIATHFHLDHVGGLLDENGAAVFPAARLVARRAEYDHWMREEHLATLDEMRNRILRGIFPAYPNHELVDGDYEVAPGIFSVPLPGHTPGHSGVLVDSEGALLLHILDAMATPLQINLPDARPRFDILPEVAIATRRAIIERVSTEEMQLLAYHFPFPGLGRIHGQDGRYAWAPENPSDRSLA